MREQSDSTSVGPSLATEKAEEVNRLIVFSRRVEGAAGLAGRLSEDLWGEGGAGVVCVQPRGHAWSTIKKRVEEVVLRHLV